MTRRFRTALDLASAGLIAGLLLITSPTPATALDESQAQHVGDCPHASCGESNKRAVTAAPGTLRTTVDGALADVPDCCTANAGPRGTWDIVGDGEGVGEALAAAGRQHQQQQQQHQSALQAGSGMATVSEAVQEAFGGAQISTEPQAAAPSSASASELVAGAGAAADAAALGAASAGPYATAASAAFGTLTAAAAAAADTAAITMVAEGEAGAGMGARSTAADSDKDAAAAANAAAARRTLAATYPSLVANGSASASFPAAAFGAWCAADTACAAAAAAGSGLNLTLLHTTDSAAVAAITSAVLNWPSPLSAAAGSGLTVTAQALVSGVVELQLEGYAGRKDSPICPSSSGSGSCAAQLVIPLLSGAVDVTKSTACIRLEPTILGTGYQAVGYPAGSTDGTAVVGIITNNALRCNTTKFGKHVIMQYRQASAVPPSPPASTPPPPPAPPPPLNATGAVLTSEVELKVKVVVGVSFAELKASNDTLTQLKSSLEGSLASSLDSQVPALLLLSRGLASASSGTISRISRYEGATNTAVTVEFVIRVPAGATEAQISALVSLLTSNTTAIFAGSVYTSKFMGPAAVTRVVAEAGAGISVGGAVGIALGCLAGLVLLLGGGYALYRYRAYQALLPKRPDGDWDEYGVAVVQPRRDNKDWAARRQQRAKPSAVVPVESEAAAVVPPPWAGANAPTMDPAAGGGAATQAQAPVPPGAMVGAGGGGGVAAAAGGDGGAAGHVGDGGGGPGAGGGLKSEADLRAAWG